MKEEQIKSGKTSSLPLLVLDGTIGIMGEMDDFQAEIYGTSKRYSAKPQETMPRNSNYEGTGAVGLINF